MEPQSESNKKSWYEENNRRNTEDKMYTDTESPGNTSAGIQSGIHTSEEHTGTFELTQADIENGAREALSFIRERTGRTLINEELDKETATILHKINESRRGWSDDMESDARAALQTIYPDIRGVSATGNPL